MMKKFDKGVWRIAHSSWLMAHGVGRYTLLVSCVLCLVPGRVSAQEAVEVESDVVSIESEMALEEVLEAKLEQRQKQQQQQPLEVKTRLKESDWQAPSSQSDQQAPARQWENRQASEVIDQQMLDVERSAVSADVIGEEELVRLNKSLRRAIEQNRQLQEEKQRMQDELGKMRGESQLEETKRTALQNQVKRYEDRLKQAVQVQQNLDGTIEELQGKIKTREEILLARINDLQKQLEEQVLLKGKPPVVPAALAAAGVSTGRDFSAATEGFAPGQEPLEDQADVVVAQESSLNLFELIDELDVMRENMRTDEARVHYNMGTIFYHQGKYDEAVDEFTKAVAMAPDDANAHFNLAYVAGDFLNEYQIANEHYRMYLYLQPEAEDAPLVREKILEAQLNIRAWEDREVDREVQEDLPRGLYNW